MWAESFCFMMRPAKIIRVNHTYRFGNVYVNENADLTKMPICTTIVPCVSTVGG
jgi:hypothetical protein